MAPAASGDEHPFFQPSEATFNRMGDLIRQGGLVAFPTETVYGLGANALDAVAVKKIFEAKKRPPTDPVICHVSEAKMAMPLIHPDVSEVEWNIFDALSSTFWPGPLTIVMRASTVVPPEVSASTGNVGIRCPNHSVALELIRAAMRPIAAPSANQFTHISPTRPSHVQQEFRHLPDIPIICGGDCEVGIESTVVRPEVSEIKENTSYRMIRLSVLRRGALTPEDLTRALVMHPLIGHHQIEVLLHPALVPGSNADADASSAAQGMDAPGLMSCHYAPSCPAFLLHSEDVPTKADLESTQLKIKDQWTSLVLIDLHGELNHTSPFVMGYLSLAGEGLLERTCETEAGTEASTISERQTIVLQRAMANCFAVLRKAEAIVEKQRDQCTSGSASHAILVHDSPVFQSCSVGRAIHDRLRRSCSLRYYLGCGHSTGFTFLPNSPEDVSELSGG